MTGPEDTADALARNLRRLRGERALTLEELARRASISRSMLIQIEQKRVNPTLATLVRIAQALDVGLAELVELGSRRRVRVIARDDVAELWTSPGGGSGRLLVGSDQLDHIEFWDWRLEPGDVHEAEAHLPGTAEILHVLEGGLTLEVDGETHAAADGESVVFSADADHSYGNQGPRPLRVFMIVITPPAATAMTPGNDSGSGGAP
ncbi:MAG TPA: XRE family transcriptional regulator [Thermoleophilia bacterium]